MINSDLNLGGIYRGFIINDNDDVRIYVPGLNNLVTNDKNIINSDGTVNSEVYEKNKNILPKPIWCLPNLEAKQHDDAHPCWVSFENGNAKRPIIMGYLGKGIKYHAGGGGGLYPGGVSIGVGKKVLIVPGHSTRNLHSENTPGCETNYGTFIYTNDARGENGECKYTRATAQYMYNYIEQNSPGLSKLYNNEKSKDNNMIDSSQSLFNDIFNKEIPKGFFNNYQAIVEIHYNSGGNGMFLKDEQMTDTNVISIGKEMCQALIDNGYPSSTEPVSTTPYKNKCLVTQRCSILDGNQAYYYMETKNMDKGVTEEDYKKIGEALGKVICSHYKVISGGGIAATAAAYARSLLNVKVSYSQTNRTGNFESDAPTSLDCSSFVYWCYYKAKVLPYPADVWATFEWYDNAKSSNYFEILSAPYKSDCESYMNNSNLQEGDILLRSIRSDFGYGNSSHILIVAPGTYNGNSFKYVECSGAGQLGAGAVRGSNTFFNDNDYYAILRLKGSNNNSNNKMIDDISNGNINYQ